MANVAIIGGGISGMASAYVLAKNHHVEVFESESYLGGHTHTHRLNRADGDWNIDTGFIVYNDKTYPQLLRLLQALNVQGQKTTMSFSVRDDEHNLEYNGTSLNTLFCQRRNIARPSFLRMIADIFAFNRDCKQLLKEPPNSLSLRDFIGKNRYSRAFSDWYIRPMAAAVWSTGTENILEMPVFFLARFFENHGFLNINDRPQWYSVVGGSWSYATAIQSILGPRIHLNQSLRCVRSKADRVELEWRDGARREFDHVILACHSDSALQLLESPSNLQSEILGSFSWSSNQVLLHTDTSIMPRRKLGWAAWNYHLLGEAGRSGEKAAVTYHMNQLQRLNAREDFLVSLNSKDLVNPARVIKTLSYQHPIFNARATSAQARWAELKESNPRVLFAGAYWFNGFHEDGVCSALRAAQVVDPRCDL